MSIFEKIPRLRIVFLLNCLLYPLDVLIYGNSWPVVLITLLFFLLDGCIALVKANVFSCPRAKAVNNLSFDLVNSFAIIAGAADVISYCLAK